MGKEKKVEGGLAALGSVILYYVQPALRQVQKAAVKTALQVQNTAVQAVQALDTTLQDAYISGVEQGLIFNPSSSETLIAKLTEADALLSGAALGPEAAKHFEAPGSVFTQDPVNFYRAEIALREFAVLAEKELIRDTLPEVFKLEYEMLRLRIRFLRWAQEREIGTSDLLIDAESGKAKIFREIPQFHLYFARELFEKWKQTQDPKQRRLYQDYMQRADGELNALAGHFSQKVETHGTRYWQQAEAAIAERDTAWNKAKTGFKVIGLVVGAIVGAGATVESGGTLGPTVWGALQGFGYGALAGSVGDGVLEIKRSGTISAGTFAHIGTQALLLRYLPNWGQNLGSRLGTTLGNSSQRLGNSGLALGLPGVVQGTETTRRLAQVGGILGRGVGISFSNQGGQYAGNQMGRHRVHVGKLLSGNFNRFNEVYSYRPSPDFELSGTTMLIGGLLAFVSLHGGGDLLKYWNRRKPGGAPAVNPTKPGFGSQGSGDGVPKGRPRRPIVHLTNVTKPAQPKPAASKAAGDSKKSEEAKPTQPREHAIALTGGETSQDVVAVGTPAAEPSLPNSASVPATLGEKRLALLDARKAIRNELHSLAPQDALAFRRELARVDGTADLSQRVSEIQKLKRRVDDFRRVRGQVIVANNGPHGLPVVQAAARENWVVDHVDAKGDFLLDEAGNPIQTSGSSYFASGEIGETKSAEVSLVPLSGEIEVEEPYRAEATGVPELRLRSDSSGLRRIYDANGEVRALARIENQGIVVQNFGPATIWINGQNIEPGVEHYVDRLSLEGNPNVVGNFCEVGFETQDGTSQISVYERINVRLVLTPEELEQIGEASGKN